MRFLRSANAALILLLALTVAAGPARAQSAQSLIEDYARVLGIVNDTTVYVGEFLQSCAIVRELTEAQAKARLQAYLLRNDAILRRADSWGKETEKRLREQGQARALRERGDEAGFSAVAGGAKRARSELSAAGDQGAACKAKLAAIDSGALDLDRNADLVAIVYK